MFVIIGLVVFAIIFIALYLVQQAEIEDVPEEAIVYDDARLNPVYQDIESCIYQLTKEALIDLGRQGGVLDLNSRSFIYNQQPAYINNAVELFEGSGLIVPYWFGIRGGPNCVDCSYHLNIPTLTGESETSIQRQVERYVEDSLGSCTSYLVRHENNFDVTIDSQPSADVQFLNSMAVVRVDWPIKLDVLGEDTTFDINNYNAEVDVNVRAVYETAYDVLSQLVMNKGILDDFAIEVSNAAAMGGVQGDIPPRSGGQVFDGEMFNSWLLSDVREVLNQEIVDHIHYLQVVGSRDSHLIAGIEDPNLDAFISGFSHYIFGPDPYLSNLKINFDYFPSWPLHVGVNPSRGEFIMPREEFSINLPMVRMSVSNYDFTYDLSFPVLITIEDVDAFDGEGFTLMFASEANIRHSQRYTDEIEIIDDQDLFTGFYDPMARTIPVRVDVVNEFGAPVEGVTIDYSCVDESVIVGISESDNGQAVVDSLLPTCVGGRFNVVGMDYFASPLEASILEGENNHFEMVVYQEKEVNLLFSPKNVVQASGSINRDIFDGGRYIENWTLASEASTTRASEEIILVFHRLINGEESGYIKAVEIEAGDIETRSVELVPGEYTLFLQSTAHLDDEFKTESITAVDMSWIQRRFSGGPREVVIEGVSLNKTLIKGFLYFDTDNPLVITSEDINEGAMRVFYPRIIYNEIITYTPDLEAIGYMMEASEEERDKLLPEFVN